MGWACLHSSVADLGAQPSTSLLCFPPKFALPTACLFLFVNTGALILLRSHPPLRSDLMFFIESRLVAPEKEPITPFISRVRALYETKKVSSILVIGGCGDYFEVADTVIMMDCYVPKVRCVLYVLLPLPPPPTPFPVSLFVCG